MLHKLFFTTVLAILVLGQGAVSVSVPQTFLVLCGCPEDPPCPPGTVCCKPETIPQICQGA
ncbi:hypothetical protein B0H14DRAFT_3513172 [Mycena olivaceomarginata]|nr:hypothetical protein B0H14DRAFT_3513172 [Mycena olivaceomarginata]